jgi:histidine triad (HIT) family protein
MSEDCIFCSIVAGAVPAARIYEDQHVLAFLDIGPVEKGHTLVIPKFHHNPLMETPAAVLQQVIVVVRTVARAQMKSLHALGISVSQANGEVAGQVVPHIHFHVIPRFETGAHIRNWNSGKYESGEQMQDVARCIREALD